MLNFGVGLALGLVGAILWFGTSVVIGIVTGLGGESIRIVNVLMYVGFVVMVGGPLTFWVILPIRNRIRRSR